MAKTRHRMFDEKLQVDEEFDHAKPDYPIDMITWKLDDPVKNEVVARGSIFIPTPHTSNLSCVYGEWQNLFNSMT